MLPYIFAIGIIIILLLLAVLDMHDIAKRVAYLGEIEKTLTQINNKLTLREQDSVSYMTVEDINDKLTQIDNKLEQIARIVAEYKTDDADAQGKE